MKKITTIITLTLFTIIMSSCMLSGVQGSKKVTTETRVIKSSFDAIKVSMGIEVLLSQGKESDIEVEMDDNIHELLVTEVEDGVLHVYFSEQVGHCEQKRVRISMPTITGLKASSGSSIKGLTLIEATDIDLGASSGAGLNLDIEANRIECDSSSGANVNLKGTCKNVYLNSSSGSSIRASKLEAVTSKANASSGANIKLYTTNSIDATASSGGSIFCKGNPKHKSISKSSGGNVTVDN